MSVGVGLAYSLFYYYYHLLHHKAATTYNILYTETKYICLALPTLSVTQKHCCSCSCGMLRCICVIWLCLHWSFSISLDVPHCSALPFMYLVCNQGWCVDIAPGCTVLSTHSNISVTKYLCCVDGSQQVKKNWLPLWWLMMQILLQEVNNFDLERKALRTLINEVLQLLILCCKYWYLSNWVIVLTGIVLH